ncbi:MAG: hypothetical protein Q9160_001492 [Pyrenula sp. 1 TL-2023]
MTKALHKVQKHISKKKGGKVTALHENSRDAKRLRQASAREEKLGKLVTATVRANQLYIDRIAWFQDRLDDDRSELGSSVGLQHCVERFINRHQEELEHLKAERRPGRPPSKQEERLQHRRDEEGKEIQSGFWAPDLANEQCIQNLKKWNGQWHALNTLTFVRITQDGQVKPSSFPPKSQS